MCARNIALPLLSTLLGGLITEVVNVRAEGLKTWATNVRLANEALARVVPLCPA
jgi:hypothetical protein